MATIVVVSEKCHRKSLSSRCRVLTVVCGLPAGDLVVVALELFIVFFDHSVELLVDGFSKVVYWKKVVAAVGVEQPLCAECAVWCAYS